MVQFGRIGLDSLNSLKLIPPSVRGGPAAFELCENVNCI